MSLIHRIRRRNGLELFKITATLRHDSQNSGDDAIYGFNNISDFIDGGTAMIASKVKAAMTRICFARGYGEDTISDIGVERGLGLVNGGEDSLILEGIAAADVTFSRTDLDLIITVDDTGDRVILEDQYVRVLQQGYAIEFLKFSDQTIEFTTSIQKTSMSLAPMPAKRLQVQTLQKHSMSGGDDTLVGGTAETFTSSMSATARKSL